MPKRGGLVVVSACVVLATAGAPAGSAQTDIVVEGVVARVIDGDTIVVLTDEGEATIRLLGINSPESTSRVECGGRAATRAMKRLAEVGEPVQLRTDSSQDLVDRFGHVLAYVTLDGGRLLQREMLVRGWAKVYVFENRFKQYDRFRRAQLKARRGNRGVFKKCGGRV